MLDYIRSNAQSFGIKLAFGIIILVFVFWGVGSFSDGNSVNTVATVNSDPIHVQQFERAYRNAEETALSKNPSLTREHLKMTHLGRQVLQDLVFQLLLVQEAARTGITLSPVELRQAAGQIKVFQNAVGRFDPETYKRILSAQRLNINQYEQDMSASLLRDKIYAMLTAPVWSDMDEAKKRYNFLREKRLISYIFLPAKNFTAPVSPADTEIQSFYDAHQQDFQVPPKVDIEYVLVKPESALKNTDSATAETAKQDADKLHEILDSLMEDNILNKPLNQSAASFGLTAQQTGLATQVELEKTLGLSTETAALLIASSAGTPIDTILEAGANYLAVRILKTEPAAVQQLNAVRNTVLARMHAVSTLKSAQDSATLISKELTDALGNAKSNKNLQIKTASVQRGGDFLDFAPNPDMSKAIFAAEPGAWLPTVFTVNNNAEGPGALLCRIETVEKPDIKEWDGIKSLMGNIVARERVDGLAQIFMLNLLSKARVEVLNQDVVDRNGL